MSCLSHPYYVLLSTRGDERTVKGSAATVQRTRHMDTYCTGITITAHGARVGIQTATMACSGFHMHSLILTPRFRAAPLFIVVPSSVKGRLG
eukprot:scaffold10376_cov131-Isochrysis_galbana.AAC.4